MKQRYEAVKRLNKSRDLYASGLQTQLTDFTTRFGSSIVTQTEKAGLLGLLFPGKA